MTVPHTPPLQVANRQTGGVGQVKQISPLRPQFWMLGGDIQGPVAVSQQPCGQLVALQTHRPCASQTVPGGQGTQIAPSLPQSLFVGGVMQGPFAVSQHPSGQLWALQPHSPCALQASPSGQSTHRAPLMPQASSFGCGLRHSPGLPGPLVQHPFGQLC
jgi:hypothetical protein